MASFALEHLDHKTFAAILDTLFEEGLDFLCSLSIGGLGERKFTFDFPKVFPQKLPALYEGTVQERLGILLVAFKGGEQIARTSPLR